MDNEEFHRPGQKILEIIKNGYKNERDLLFLFSSYIASNPDFKYNTTYLTDSIEQFFQDYDRYSQKKLIFEEIINYINNNNTLNQEVEIEFDSKFTFNTKKNTALEILEYNYYDDSFNFHEIGSQFFTLKLTLIKPIKVEYTFNIETNKKSNHWKMQIENFLRIIQKYQNEE